MIHGNVSKPNGITPILYLDTAKTMGRENVELPSPDAVKALLAERPEVQAVMFQLAGMPRRAVPVEKVTDALLRKAYRGRQ